jgi:hypothetical protein
LIVESGSDRFICHPKSPVYEHRKGYAAQIYASTGHVKDEGTQDNLVESITTGSTSISKEQVGRHKAIFCPNPALPEGQYYTKDEELVCWSNIPTGVHFDKQNSKRKYHDGFGSFSKLYVDCNGVVYRGFKVACQRAVLDSRMAGEFSSDLGAQKVMDYYNSLPKERKFVFPYVPDKIQTKIDEGVDGYFEEEVHACLSVTDSAAASAMWMADSKHQFDNPELSEMLSSRSIMNETTIGHSTWTAFYEQDTEELQASDENLFLQYVDSAHEMHGSCYKAGAEQRHGPSIRSYLPLAKVFNNQSVISQTAELANAETHCFNSVHEYMRCRLEGADIMSTNSMLRMMVWTGLIGPRDYVTEARIPNHTASKVSPLVCPIACKAM